MKYHVVLFIILSSILFPSCKEELPTDKPNFIIILTDDQGYADVGFNGCRDIPTPHIDRIAANGVKFTDAYVSYSVCGPSRAGLITGRYQDRFGFGRNPLFAANDSLMGLALTEETIADFTGREGYRTKAIGKWHLGAHASLRPLKRGFDEFFGFLTGGHQYFPEEWTLQDLSGVKAQYDAYRTKILDNDQRIEETEYLTDALSREAVSFVEQNSKDPFFLYLAYNAPHGPLQATQEYLARFDNIKDPKRKTYAAMVSAVDDGVGLLLDKLEELGILENTLVFFLSDNGGPEQVNGSDNSPLRDGKGSLFEGGVRVPFAMMWQNGIKGPLVYDQVVSSLDIAATIAVHAGASPANKLDGVDLIPYVSGKNSGSPHEYLFWRKFDQKAYAVRAGQMKLVNDRKVKDGLFNLESDISEANELSDQNMADSLKKQKDLWEKEMVDPVFMGLGQDKEYSREHPERFTMEAY